jgi:hypothetical protein
MSFFIAADPAHLSGTGTPAMKNHSAAFFGVPRLRSGINNQRKAK